MRVCWNQLLGHKKKLTEIHIHMETLSKYLSHKVKYITSSFYSCMLLWKAKPPFPLKNKPERHRKGGLLVGLKTLVRSEEKQPPRIVHCNQTVVTAKPKPKPKPSSSPRLLSLWLSSSPMFQSTMMGDVIGTESGDCMITDELVDVEAKAEPEARKVRSRDRSGRRREFPPRISLLRESRGMPWKFKREYSHDGRLVITAERVRLVPEDHDDGVYCEECGYLMDDDDDDDDDEEEEDSEDVEFVDDEEEKSWIICNLAQKCSLGECVTYADAGFLHDSDSLWKGTGMGDANVYMGRACSASLRPMTSVM